MPKAVISS